MTVKLHGAIAQGNIWMSLVLVIGYAESLHCSWKFDVCQYVNIYVTMNQYRITVGCPRTLAIHELK